VVTLLPFFAATQALINAVADSGFNVVRPPIAWETNP
jgi:hypothetical protein